MAWGHGVIMSKTADPRGHPSLRQVTWYGARALARQPASPGALPVIPPIWWWASRGSARQCSASHGAALLADKGAPAGARAAPGAKTGEARPTPAQVAIGRSIRPSGPWGELGQAMGGGRASMRRRSARRSERCLTRLWPELRLGDWCRPGTSRRGAQQGSVSTTTHQAIGYFRAPRRAGGRALCVTMCGRSRTFIHNRVGCRSGVAGPPLQSRRLASFSPTGRRRSLAAYYRSTEGGAATRNGFLPHPLPL
jgi:hypothetical protein